MAIPLVARSGGLLIAVPEPYLDNDALLDAAVDSHDGVLGPSQEFVSELCEEDDETNLVPLGRTCSVLVLDVSDAALAHFAEYDPVTHDFDSCLSFDNNRPAALPVITDIFEDIKAWIQATAEGSRVHFYSAREEIEEPAPPKAAASKRGPPRKITNQAIMEQLSSLSMQMQALASQQEELRQGASQASAIPVPAASGLLPISSKVPSLSGGLQPPANPLASVAKMVGPPPKTKSPDVSNAAKGQAAAPPPTQNLENADHSSIVHAISQQSMALTALVSHLAGGDPMSELQMGGASSSGLSLSTRGAARRERMQQDLAARRSNYFLQVQQQLFLSIAAGPTVGSRACWSRSDHDRVLGEAWRISKSEGSSHGPLDSSSCYGLRHDGRYAWMQRVSGYPSDMFGAGSSRRRMGSRLSPLLTRGSTKQCVFGEGPNHAGHDPALQSSSPATMGSMCLSVHQRNGCADQQKGRTTRRRRGEAKESTCITSRPSRGDTSPRRRPKFPKKPGSADPKAA